MALRRNIRLDDGTHDGYVTGVSLRKVTVSGEEERNKRLIAMGM